jgi:Adenylate and Guanylate cyclase catalytic domain/Double zinc ribbon
MQCPRCQARNRQGRRFCAQCGAPLAFPCASCGFSNEPGEKFCGGGGLALTPADRPPDSPPRAPHTYTPSDLVDKILPLKSALEGERKQVAVLFADFKDSTELIRGLDPEAAQRLLDPALQRMMDAVHRFEGTVNQVLGDGIMALFGAPIAHEDHALRACYAALAMQAAMRAFTEDVRRAHGLEIRIRVFDQGLALRHAFDDRNLLRAIAAALLASQGLCNDGCSSHRYPTGGRLSDPRACRGTFCRGMIEILSDTCSIGVVRASDWKE